MPCEKNNHVVPEVDLETTVYFALISLYFALITI